MPYHQHLQRISFADGGIKVALMYFHSELDAILYQACMT
jgi:hypothetical protein